MAYTDRAALADNPEFRARVRVALATASVQVMGEDKAAMSDTKFGKRQSLAYDVLRAAASGMLLEAFIWSAIANVAITAESLDSDIEFTVDAAWDDMAGVRIND